MKGLVLAIQFLTRLPMPKVTANETDFARSIRWFPAVGAIVGLSVMFAVNLGVHIDPWIGALAGLLCWVGMTGALSLSLPVGRSYSENTAPVCSNATPEL